MGNPGLFFLGIFCGLLIPPIFKAIFRRKKRVPAVLGSSVPLTPHSIDFSRRYHVTVGVRYGGGEYRQFHAVRIIGYVEHQKRGVEKFPEDWVVAELLDGRKLYFTPESIRSMEETGAETQAP